MGEHAGSSGSISVPLWFTKVESRWHFYRAITNNRILIIPDPSVLPL
jgi:hypothetical protein